jgi:hypothetical protein
MSIDIDVNSFFFWTVFFLSPKISLTFRAYSIKKISKFTQENEDWLKKQSGKWLILAIISELIIRFRFHFRVFIRAFPHGFGTFCFR